jgi:hypothetical protein
METVAMGHRCAALLVLLLAAMALPLHRAFRVTSLNRLRCLSLRLLSQNKWNDVNNSIEKFQISFNAQSEVSAKQKELENLISTLNSIKDSLDKDSKQPGVERILNPPAAASSTTSSDTKVSPSSSESAITPRNSDYSAW